MKKGLTYVELLVVLGLISVIIGIISGVFQVKNYFAKSRDLQRLQDMNLLYSALDFYFQNATSADPDGPYLYNRGIDESSSTIFVSVPKEAGTFLTTYIANGKTYYIYQSNKNNYKKIDGSGWVPINFYEVLFSILNSLPSDPINSTSSNLYYLYAFRRKPLQFEVSAAFESSEFQKNGSADIVSNDGGNDENRLELGTNLDILPRFIW